jgi:hypothetical protein
VHPMLALFAPDIHWTPHPFDGKEENVSYSNICPTGGPGGLICCEVCTATYSKYLSATYQDVEEQRTSKVAGELTQLVGFMTNTKKKLGKTVRRARKKSIPINRKRPGVQAIGPATPSLKK